MTQEEFYSLRKGDRVIYYGQVCYVSDTEIIYPNTHCIRLKHNGKDVGSNSRFPSFIWFIGKPEDHSFVKIRKMKKI